MKLRWLATALVALASLHGTGARPDGQDVSAAASSLQGAFLQDLCSVNFLAQIADAKSLFTLSDANPHQRDVEATDLVILRLGGRPVGERWQRP